MKLSDQITFRVFSLVLTLFVFPLSSVAQNMVTDLDEKFRLEKAISERLEQALKTRLEKQYFDITVEVQLSRKNPSLQMGGKARGETPDELQRWYNNQLRNLSRHISSGEGLDMARPFELDSVSITLGLSDRVQENYREDLRIWLQKWVATSFGEKGSIALVVRPSNIIAKKSSPPTTQKFDIGRYQNLIGLMFLGLVFGFAFLLQIFRNKPSKTQGHGLSPLPSAALPATGTLPPPPPPALPDARALAESCKNKIVMIAPGLQSQIELMVQKWSYGEHQNYLKIVALLEALAEKGPSLNRESKSSIPALPPHMHAQLAKGLAELQMLQPEHLLALYQEIYTEMLIGSPLAVESVDPEYKFLEHLDNEAFLNLLSFLDDDYKVALLNHLTSEQRRQYSDLVSREEFARILNHSMTCEEPAEKDFKEKISQWKKVSHSLRGVDLHLKLAKLREILSAFSRLEGAIWLHQLSVQHPQIKKLIQEDGPQIAFLADWSPETLRKFCQSTKTRELAAAAKCLPFLSSTLLSGCGEVTRMAVETEMLKLMDPQKIVQAFDAFVESFDNFTESTRMNPVPLSSSHSPTSHLKDVA